MSVVFIDPQFFKILIQIICSTWLWNVSLIDPIRSHANSASYTQKPYSALAHRSTKNVQSCHIWFHANRIMPIPKKCTHNDNNQLDFRKFSHLIHSHSMHSTSIRWIWVYRVCLFRVRPLTKQNAVLSFDDKFCDLFDKVQLILVRTKIRTAITHRSKVLFQARSCEICVELRAVYVVFCFVVLWHGMTLSQIKHNTRNYSIT